MAQKVSVAFFSVLKVPSTPSTIVLKSISLENTIQVDGILFKQLEKKKEKKYNTLKLLGTKELTLAPCPIGISNNVQIGVQKKKTKGFKGRVMHRTK